MSSIIKKHLTTDAVIIPADDGVYAQQVNYGTSLSTPSNRSVTDVIVRHFEDYNANFVVDKIKTGFVCSQGAGTDINVSLGSANVKGIWVTSDGVLTTTISTTDGTYYVVLIKGDDALGAEARIPLNDTISLGSIIAGSFDETIHYPIAKVVIASSVISSFEDYGAFYHLRQDYIKPKNGSTVKLFTGSHPNATTLNTWFSGTKVLNKQDGAYQGGGIYTGFNDDLQLYHLSGTGNMINNDNSQDMWVRLDDVAKFGFRSTGFEVVNNLTVSGTSAFSGAVVMESTLEVRGALAVSGAMTFDDNMNILGTLSVSGTTLIDDTLQVLGATTLSSTLNAIGASSFSGAVLVDDTLEVIGATSFSGAMLVDNNFALSGTATINGTLSQHGVATFNDKIVLVGELQAQSLISGTNIYGSQLSGTSIVTDGTLNVSGTTVIDDTFKATGISRFMSDFYVTSNSVFSGTTNHIGASSFSGAVLIDDNLQALGVTRLESDLYVNGNSVFSGTSSFSGAVLIDDTLDVWGIARLESDLYTDGNTTLSGTLAVVGATTLTGTARGAMFSGTSFKIGTLAVAEFSTDNTLAGQSDTVLVTENAIRDHVFNASGVLASEISSASGVLNTAIGVNAGNISTNTSNISTISGDYLTSSHVTASAHHTKYAITDTFTSGEVTQMQNIGTSTISSVQWGYLGAMNQNVTLTSSVGFTYVNISGSGGIAFSYPTVTVSLAGTGTSDLKISMLNGKFYPADDNSYDLGGISNRWDDVYATNGTIQTSGLQFKKNVVKLERALDKITSLSGYNYNWRDEFDSGKEIKKGKLIAGLVAQEVSLIIPEAVVYDDDGVEVGMRYNYIIPYLVESIKELNDENKLLKERLDIVESIIDEKF